VLGLLPDFEDGRTYEVLCLGAHSDDIEIGCGGTILKLCEQFKSLSFHWVVFSSDEIRAKEAHRGADAFLNNAGKRIIYMNTFRNGYFPFIGAQIKDYFEHLKQSINPDIIFSHYGRDLHQDHRLVSELTWNTFRNHFILEYEIVKYDGDLGSPNSFVPLKKPECDKKIDLLLRCYESQASHHWFSREAFKSLMRIRGIESNAPTGYAEAFYCRKLTFRFDGEHLEGPRK
jgi:LmbE family N-acetylglucosaminyl deacetylase